MRRIQCYDAEQYRKTGCGRVSVEIQIEGKKINEIQEEIDQMKNFYKMKNRKWRESLLSKPCESPAPEYSPGSISSGSFFSPSSSDSQKKYQEKNQMKEKEMKKEEKKEIKIITSKNFKDLHLDPNTGNTTFLIGSSKRGKSTLLMNIFKNYYNTKNDISVLFSINSHIPLYKNKKLNEESEKLVKQMKYINYKCENKYKFCLMFDDITNVRYNNLMNELILTYRNSNISSVVSLQYPNLLSKQARGSINNVLFFGLNNDESIKVALDSFLKSHFSKMGVIGEINQINFYRKMTDDHKFIYLHPESGKISFNKLSLN